MRLAVKPRQQSKEGHGLNGLDSGSIFLASTGLNKRKTLGKKVIWSKIMIIIRKFR